MLAQIFSGRDQHDWWKARVSAAPLPNVVLDQLVRVKPLGGRWRDEGAERIRQEMVLGCKIQARVSGIPRLRCEL